MALTIQNLTYANVAFVNSPVTLTAKDNNGNTFARTTIAVNTNGGNVTVNLPYIPSLADDLLFEIVILITNDANDVIINAAAPNPVIQRIGSAGSITVAAGGGVGQSVVLRPVSEGVWSTSITA
jgi:hypothetical protein